MGGSSAPPAPPAVTIPPPIPAIQSPQGIAAGQTVATRAQSATGPAATVLTGANGLQQANQAPAATKTLLGS